MFKLLILVAFVPALVLGQATDVRPCDGITFPHEVRVQGCTSMPCRIRRGQEAVMEMDFTLEETATTLRPRVVASVLGLNVEYPLADELLNACDNLDTQCPVEAGSRTMYTFRFPVNANYPPIPVGVQLNLLNQDDGVTHCFAVDIQVTLF